MPLPTCVVRKSLNIDDDLCQFVVEFAHGHRAIAVANRKEMDKHLYEYLFSLRVGEVIPTLWLPLLELIAGEIPEEAWKRLVATRKDRNAVSHLGNVCCNHRAGRSWTTKGHAPSSKTEAQIVVDLLFKWAKHRGVLGRLKETDGRYPAKLLRKMLRIIEGGRW